MKIRTQIISLATILLVLLVIETFFSLNELSKIGSSLQAVATRSIPLSNAITQITIKTQAQALNFERSLRFAKQIEDGDASASIPFHESWDEFVKIAETTKAEFLKMKSISSTKGLLADPPNLQDMTKKLTLSEELYLDYENQALLIFNLLKEKQLTEAEIEILTILGKEESLKIALDELNLNIQKLVMDSAADAKRIQSTAVTGMSFISLVALFLGLFLALVITHKITDPLNQAVEVANQIAQGNKEVVVPHTKQSEISRLLEAMREMLTSIKSSEIALENRATELSRSNAELEQFAYVASHDLQEPLRMVSSFTQLLKRKYGDKLDSTAEEYIDFAVDGVNRMQNLINDLLSYSRINKTKLSSEPVDLNEVITELIETFGDRIPELGAKINYASLPTIQGYRLHFKQLFQNLISNALKFHGDNPPVINIEAKLENEKWVFSVSDNGLGIRPEFKEKIFNIFQRLHTRDEYPGTGIGLAICKKLVEQYGGKIWVESELHKGSTFYFTLPLNT